MPGSMTLRGGAPRSRRLVKVYPDPATMALVTAGLIVAEARRAVKTRGVFTIAIAGGSTPRETYRLLARPPFSDLMPWEKVQVFWSDERCVGPDDPRSNERMARVALLDHVPIPPDHVHPMRCLVGGAGGGEDDLAGADRAAWTCADRYDELLGTFFPTPGGPSRLLKNDVSPPGRDGQAQDQDARSVNSSTIDANEDDVLRRPVRPGGQDFVLQQPPGASGIDLVLLGLGENGHTASLFPGAEALLEEKRRAVAALVDAAAGSVTTAGGQDLWRITLTAAFINKAASVVFLVSGTNKAIIVREVLEGPRDAAYLPAGLIHPEAGILRWHLDDDAAALLGQGMEES